ncbi:MAG TPA: DUF692 family protein [Candidatus Krumholzibacteria bacterium]|nr:DUF692 family protein [Candidatus Krumholzibacteria bacterium]
MHNLRATTIGLHYRSATMSDFSERVQHLPRLGIGVSTEYGAGDAPGGLDVEALRREHPRWAEFLEVGVETSKGLDRDARAWAAAGRPTTYHFLDVNLDDPRDLDARWLDEVCAIAAELQPAWMCGDAGLWHFGPRGRGQMLLLPPVLSDDAASAMAEGIVRLREETGHEVLPENPPGSVYVGPLHLLDFFARVCERADTGMLLDVAHLAIYQRTAGHDAFTGVDAFPLERVVEMHVAGGVQRTHEGYDFVEDSHTTDVLLETWHLLEHLAPRTPNLKAVVFECERNPLEAVVDGFARIERTLGDSTLAVRP